MRSPKINRNQGFKLIRRVVAVKEANSDNHHCKSYETEDLVPLEIFDSFNFNVDGKIPFRMSTYSDNSLEVESKKRQAELQQQQGGRSLQGFPGYNLVSCSNSMFGDEQKSFNGPGGGSGSIALARRYVCIDYQYLVPGSIGANYDFNSQSAAAKSLAITGGVTCESCYAFIGANTQANIQYSSSKGFGFNARLSGGAGFAVDFRVNDPQVSASTTRGISAPQPNFRMFTVFQTAGGSLQVGVKSGAVTATLSGTGKAQGSASFTVKAQLSGSIDAVCRYGGSF
jgi:hypothetical protein